MPSAAPKQVFVAASKSFSTEDCIKQTKEMVSELRDKTFKSGDIVPDTKNNSLATENAKSLPVTMTKVFLEEVGNAYGERPPFQVTIRQ